MGTPINYDASLSTDDLPANDVLSYVWDFEYDGSTINEMSTSVTGTYVFNTGGSYDVLLEITDSYGCPDTLVFPVDVFEAPIAVMDLEFDACDFTMFYDGSQSIENNLPQNLEYFWDFGEGQTSNQQIGTVTYASCGTYTVTLTVTDPDAPTECNTDFVSQVVTFDDSPPTLSCPTLVTGSCSVDSIAPYTTIEEFIDAGGTATDNCPLNSIQLLEEIFDDNTCGGSLLRIYQVTDFCGQTATCEQSIEVNDDIAPTFECPPTATTNCSIVDFPAYGSLADFIAAGGSVSDNCDINPASFTIVSELSDGSSCPEIISRVYQIADICGNTAECTQIVEVNDVLPPDMIAPAPISAICDISEVMPLYSTIARFSKQPEERFPITDDCQVDSSSFGLESGNE